jgi:uncharacterized membrane protein YhfC
MASPVRSFDAAQRRQPGLHAVLLFAWLVILLLPIARPAPALAAGTPTPAPPPRATASPEELTPKALAYLDQLVKSEFDAATANFDSPMRAALPPAKLATTWQNLIQQFGPFRQVTGTRIQRDSLYDAVLVTCQFERATVDLRVVFNQAGQISGFFAVPVRVAGSANPWLILAYALGALVSIAFPLVLAVLAYRRLAAGWRFFLYGMLVFLVAQVLIRIPLISVAQPLLAPLLRNSQAFAFAWSVVLALTAGLCEEGGRYLGYRWLFKSGERRWNNAVMYGIGHGGLESMLLVGLNFSLSVVILALGPVLVTLLAGTPGAAIAQQIAQLTTVPAWLPLVGAYERVWTIFVQVGLSVLVLQAFLRGSLRWLWLAIGLHALIDLVVIVLASFLRGAAALNILLPEVVVTLAGMLALWWTWRVRNIGTDQSYFGE